MIIHRVIEFLKKNINSVLIILIGLILIILLTGILSGFNSIFLILLLVFSGSLLYYTKQQKSIITTIKIYSFLKRYTTAIFYVIISLLFISVSAAVISKIFSDDYYLVIDDLPNEFIENGYSKETLKKYLEIHTNSLNSSDEENPKMKLNDDNGRIKLEAFGNSLYINEFVLFLRDVFGQDKTINIQFGLDEQKEVFYRGTVSNNGKLFILDKRGVLFNNTSFNENHIHSLTNILTISVLMYTHPRKVISYFRKNLDELESIYQYYILNNLLENKDITYFYRVFGNTLADRQAFFEADIKYRHAIKLFDNYNLDKDHEFFNLIESYCLNLHRLGRASEASKFLKNFNPKNKTLIMVEAYLLNELNQPLESEKLYYKALSKSLFSNDSINGEYSLFSRIEACKHMLNLHLKKNDYQQALKFAERCFKEYKDNYFQQEIIDILKLKGDFNKAKEIEFHKYNNNPDYFSSKYEKLFRTFTLPILNNGVNVNRNKIYEFDSDQYYHYGDINHNFLQTTYPLSRLLVREIINISSDTILISKSYNDYIVHNPKDIQIKKEYLSCLERFERWSLLKSHAYEILKEEMNNDIFDEDVYYKAKVAELIISSNEVQYLNRTVDSITTKLHSDSLYSRLKNPFYKAHLKLMTFTKNDGYDFDYMGALQMLNTISYSDAKTNETLNLLSSSVIKNFLITAFNEGFENEINVDSLFVELIKKRGQDKETTLLWGISDELKGLSDRANQKYEMAAYLNQDFNPYLVAGEFFYSISNYELSARNYEKAIISDSINVSRKSFENFTSSYIISYLEKDIYYHDYLRYKDLANKYSVKYPLDYCFYQRIYSHRAFNTASDILNNKHQQNNSEIQKLKSLLESAISYGFNPNKFSFYPGYEKSKEVNLIKKIIRESYKDTYKFLECHGGLNYTFVQMNFDKLN